ncbi:transmembrane 220 family protein [Reichenbachiella versicolor]|uniref:transmembrane 220 family protein n=1 Tax=Reichenbachiella versicolor TaxID=1821036 RepID=UPI000D6DCEA4|nr:transmembrane 220 family protein [Reichenbachiella versicolor]
MKQKIIYGVLAVVFALFAIVQLNDPDPIKWVAMYTLVSILFVIRIFGLKNKSLTLVVMLVLLGFSLFYIPGFLEYLVQPNKNEIIGEMVYEKPYIEETREFLGLWIAAGAIFYLYKKS